MILLENEQIKLTFASKGAELQRIDSKITGFNYIWSGDPAYWAKHSPVLFPIVGALKEDKYRVNGKEYQLPRHGFARDLDFEYEYVNAAEILFTLYSNEQTLKVYPFPFVLHLRYTLAGASVTCRYEVSNPADKDLLFSLGAHPAFAAPLSSALKYEDCYLEFPDDESLVFSKIAGNLISDESGTMPLDNGKLFLKHSLFYNDALVLKHLNSRLISLKNTQNNSRLDFHFDDFPFFGIWAAKDADFVCLEPWCGIADGINHNQEFTEKEGINALSPGGQWKRNWKVEVF